LKKTVAMMTLASETFYDIDTTQPVEVALAIYTSVGGTARVDKYYPISYTIIEYGLAESTPASSIVTFDANGQTYNLPAGQSGIVSLDGTSGNGGDCLLDQSPVQDDYIEVEFTTPSGLEETITSIVYDLYADNSYFRTRVYVDDVEIYTQAIVYTLDQWETHTLDDAQTFPIVGTLIRVRVEKYTSNGSDMRLDNLGANIQ